LLENIHNRLCLEDHRMSKLDLGECNAIFLSLENVFEQEKRVTTLELDLL
jgi:hypothetical protein